jgi:hypothetical protein
MALRLRSRGEVSYFGKASGVSMVWLIVVVRDDYKKRSMRAIIIACVLRLGWQGRLTTAVF